MEDWLTHELEQLSDMVLFLEVHLHTLLDVGVEKGTLSDQRVDLLLLDLPGYSVNQKGILHGVVL